MKRKITRLMLTAGIAAGMTLGAVPAIAETAGDETIETEDAAEEASGESGYAAMTGGEGYDSLEDAVAAAEEGDTILLMDDCVVDHTVVLDRDVELDLNDFTICNTEPILDEEEDAWALISVQGANVTIGGGAVNALEDDCYAFDVRDGGILTLNDGTYVGNTSVVYVFDGILVVNDGYFSLIQESEEYGKALMFNCSDEAYEDGDAVIVVYGGTFEDWDLVDSRGVCLAAEEAEITVDEDGNYVVTTPRDEAEDEEDGDADEDTDEDADKDVNKGADEDADEAREDEDYDEGQELDEGSGDAGDALDEDVPDEDGGTEDTVSGEITDGDAEDAGDDGTEDAGSSSGNTYEDAGTAAASGAVGSVSEDTDDASGGSTGSSASLISSAKTGDPASLYALAALLSGGAGGTGIAFGRRRWMRR